MKIKIVTLSVIHSAGGLFEGNVEEDVPTSEPVPVRLFNYSLYNFSPSFRKAIFKDDADLLHMEALWRYPMMLISQSLKSS